MFQSFLLRQLGKLVVGSQRKCKCTINIHLVRAFNHLDGDNMTIIAHLGDALPQAGSIVGPDMAEGTEFNGVQLHYIVCASTCCSTPLKIKNAAHDAE